MIFITIKSGLVGLMAGLCTQILYFRFEIIDGLRAHLLLFFVEKKMYVKETKQLVQELIPPPSTYIQLCTLYTCTIQDDVELPQLVSAQDC